MIFPIPVVLVVTGFRSARVKRSAKPAPIKPLELTKKEQETLNKLMRSSYQSVKQLGGFNG